MASRIAPKAWRAASLSRSSAVASVPRIAAIQSRYNSTSSPQPPAEKASSLIDSIPGNSLVTKTGTVVLGTGLTAAAISSELYVVNEETVLAAGFIIIVSYLAKVIRAPYSDWAQSQIDKIRDTLNEARAEHTKAVSSRIDSVGELKDVVDVTKGLFALSKETAQLEHENFVLKQQTQLASDVKAVLDSWVRYEQQAKESEQAELIRSVLDKINKSLADEKNQKQILTDAVAEVERLVKSKAI